MHTLQLDGRIVPFRDGQTLLEVARENGVEIPTLCHHAGVENLGACRLCMVEITKPSWDGWSKLVTSCEFAAEDELIVSTTSEAVVDSRRTVLDLLLARCPNTPLVQELARAHGIAKTSFTPREEPDDCILCGICVRVCAAVGAEAITMSGRGVDKQVGPPFVDDAADCIGCLSCAYMCPTNHIDFERGADTRTIWGRSFDVVRCTGCGKPLGTPEQLDHFAKTKGIPRNYFDRCDLCRKQDTAKAFYDLMS